MRWSLIYLISFFWITTITLFYLKKKKPLFLFHNFYFIFQLTLTAGFLANLPLWERAKCKEQASKQAMLVL